MLPTGRKNQCAYICPHAAIRPFVLTDDELAGFDGLETLEMKAPAAMKGMHFVIEPSVLDCLGCGNCADICPGNPKTGKALTMAPFNPDAADMKQEAKNWEYLVKEVKSKQDLVDIRSNVKATPLGAIAQFAAQGKRIRKKDLGMIAITYGYVYVAQIAMGADHAQTLKAIREAEAWHGPSIVIAYAPCINHGLKAKGGMGKSQAEEKKAVEWVLRRAKRAELESWHLWRYNPALAEEGKNPFSLDSKEPNWANFHDFLLGEVRYLSVKKAYPNEAEELFAEAQKMAQLRYKTYVRKTQENWEE